MPRERPPLPPQIKPPRLRGAQEEVGRGEAGFTRLRLPDALPLQTQAGSEGFAKAFKLFRRRARRQNQPDDCGAGDTCVWRVRCPRRREQSYGVVAGSSGCWRCKSDLKAGH